MNHSKKLAVFLSFSGQGGVERMMLNLLCGFAEREYRVDLLAVRAHTLSAALPKQIQIHDLGVKHTMLALPSLMRYLRTTKPHALLAAKDRAIRIASLARRLARSDTYLVGRLGTNLSAALADKHPLQRRLRCFPMRHFYAGVDHIVAVSQGVADDTAAVARFPLQRISVIPNPVITADLLNLAQQPVTHRWFSDSGPPVILGAGRLTRQKDFPTLLRAFAVVKQQQDVRLVILGEGQQREQLTALIASLGISASVDLLGFVENPYAYMAKAALFVLSSAWEGSPNVLTEAMACGAPVVATDCPSGPREILQSGRYGLLVEVGDVKGLAQAMLKTLQHPVPKDELRAAVQDYTVSHSTRAYLNVLGMVQSEQD